MIGLQFIADTFQMEYKSVAEKIGVSKQTFQDWIKERRKIPTQRLQQLSELFGVNDVGLFQKELTESEKLDVQMFYFQKTDNVEDVEVPRIGEDGKVYLAKGTISQNQNVIDFLSERSREVRLLEDVERSITGQEPENEANKKTLSNVLQVFDSSGQDKKTLDMVLFYLTEYQKEDYWGGMPSQFSKYADKGFFEKFKALLKESGLSE
ncbi:helix-turn-helix domain-containing protein [Brevibacillus centrosporus]|uniref:helix-turn-helix domain-containing protein n=1 Tax=Brevibacillus centrosporus TaxID=54910 RepID=UPI003808FD15